MNIEAESRTEAFAATMKSPSKALALRYALITPARNEAQNIERIIQAVIQQTVRPIKWVIVSDGSTDGTDEIVRKYLAEYDWIGLMRREERAERNFAGKADAFNTGYRQIKHLNFDIIGNLDADISFDEDYFAFLLDRLAEDPLLGVAGTPFREGTATYDYRFASLEHVSGACQLFRRTCFEEIGGYLPISSGGIDVVAVLSARNHGWKTRTFTAKSCEHHRKIGSAQYTGLRERVHLGEKDYLLGSHPVWEICRSAYQMKNRPFVIGGFLIFCGYFFAMLRRRKRTIPEELMRFRRNDQIQRLKRVIAQVLRLSH